MSILALLIYAGWTLALVGAIGGLRTFYTLTGRHAANRFAPSGEDVSPLSARLCRAHANCYENLPIFVAVMLAASWSGHPEVTDGLALPFVGARVAQSMVHVVSTSVPAVMVRFAFFLAQLGILLYWIAVLTPLALG